MKKPETWTTSELIRHVNVTLDWLSQQRLDGPPLGQYSLRILQFHRAQGLISPPLGKRGRQLLFGELHRFEMIATRTLQAKPQPQPLDRITRILEGARSLGDLEHLTTLGSGPVPNDLIETCERAAPDQLRRDHGADLHESRTYGSRVSATTIAPGAYLVIDRDVYRGNLNHDHHLIERIAAVLRELELESRVSDTDEPQ